MEARKAVLGQEHPDTLISMGNLALTYLDQRRWKEAKELKMRVRATRKRVVRVSMLADQGEVQLSSTEATKATKAPKASGATDTTMSGVPKVIRVSMASEPPKAGEAPEPSWESEQAQRQTSLVPRLLWHQFWAWLHEASRQPPRQGCQRITWTCVCGFTFCFAIRSI